MGYSKINCFIFILLVAYFTKDSLGVVITNIKQQQCIDTINKVFNVLPIQNPPLKYYAEQAILHLRMSFDPEKHVFADDEGDAMLYYISMGPYLRSNGMILSPQKFCSQLVNFIDEMHGGLEEYKCITQLVMFFDLINDNQSYILQDMFLNRVQSDFYKDIEYVYSQKYMEHVAFNTEMGMVDGKEMPFPSEFCVKLYKLPE